MKYPKHKNGTECLKSCYEVHRPRKVTANWPDIGTTYYVYRLDFECGRGYKYYYFGQSYNPHLRLTQHKQKLKRSFASGGLRVNPDKVKMSVLKTFRGSGAYSKSIYTEHKLIWNYMNNKKGWEWKWFDEKTVSPRMLNKESFTFRGWIRDNKPKVYKEYLKN